MRMNRFSLLVLSTAIVCLPIRAQSWHVATTFHPGGEGGWDYVTVGARNHRLLVTRATHIRRSSVPSARLLSWGYWRQIEPDRPDLNRRSVGQQHSNRTETVIENPPTAQFVLP